MKNYIRPIAEVSKFDVADIITSSGIVMDSADLTGSAASLYADYVTKTDVVNTNVAIYQW